MGVVVMKFGGTSVADADKIRAAARRAIRTQKAGHRVVMVVSAMGKTTDHLVGLEIAFGAVAVILGLGAALAWRYHAEAVMVLTRNR